MTQMQNIRTPQDREDNYLLSIGWKFAGLTLYKYPLSTEVRGYYTKSQALKLTRELGLDLYCPMCGACGEEDCCPPDQCNCLYSEHYNKTYRELLGEHQMFYDLVVKLKNTPEVSLDELPALANQLLEELGYVTD